MSLKRIVLVLCVVLWPLAGLAGIIDPVTENIDPYEDESQYAYGENVGWLNFEPNEGPGVAVADSNVLGYVWGENIGWINLSPTTYGGVLNDGTGLLSGYAWGQNVGWINFNPIVPGDPNHYGVIIDHNGDFSGWAWGENIGWISFKAATPVAYKVQTSWITGCSIRFDDLARLVQQWLYGPPINPDGDGTLIGDLDGSGDVDFGDYSKLAGLWLELCPPGWPLAQ
ncbi:MAG: hypothetical protein JXN61_13425 [Sedimentisphaerales bacterium]|nr:hypothetical protein [Sedimentisphaerales bacterium]